MQLEVNMKSRLLVFNLTLNLSQNSFLEPFLSANKQNENLSQSWMNWVQTLIFSIKIFNKKKTRERIWQEWLNSKNLRLKN